MEMKAKEKKLQSFRTTVSFTFETKSREKKIEKKNSSLMKTCWNFGGQM